MRNQSVPFESNNRRPDRPRGMTLIELLVVITILTTLVAGVIPLLSPNNDPRKIREASREVQNYITLAQAEAARTGRPHGIFLQKLSATTGLPDDRGACLELFQIEEPAAFSGFTETSLVRIYDDAGVLRAEFGSGSGSVFTASNLELPQRMFRPGDVVEVEGRKFRLLKEDPDPVVNTDLDPEQPGGFFKFGNGITDRGFRVEWVNFKQGQLPPPNAEKYKIRRLPTRSTEPPLQLPKGVCIDLQCSGLPTLPTSAVPPPSCCHNPLTSISDPAIQNAVGVTSNDDGISILFKPDGTVDRYFWNDANLMAPGGADETVQPDRVTSQLFFLVGRRENVPIGFTNASDWDFPSNPDSHEELREKINWLNSDSRWIVIGASSGRVLATNNAFVDLNNPAYSLGTYSGSDLQQLMRSVPAQMFAARQYAREMRREGGR